MSPRPLLTVWLAVSLAVIGNCGPVLASEPPITALSFAPDGRTLVTGSQSGLVIRSWPALDPIRSLPSQIQNIHDLKFSPDGELLLVAGGSPAVSGDYELYRWPKGDRIQAEAPHNDVIYAVAWEQDSTSFATASGDRTVLVHRVGQSEPVQLLEGHTGSVLAVEFLGHDLLTAGVDQSLRLWDLESGETTRTLSNHTGPVLALVVRPESQEGELPMVASVGDDRTARFWQPTIGRMVRFARLDQRPLCAGWMGTSSRNVLAVGCRDGHVRIIDPDTVETLQDIPAFEGWVFCLASPPDGTAIVAAGTDGQILRLAVDGL